MAEVVGVVASALSIVSFAGQILQGCQNIRTFLDSINNASDDLRLFRTEVKIFMSLLESFRAILAQADWSEEPERWDLARLALDYSDEAVTGLQNLVNEYGTRKPGRWNDVKLVMRKGKFDKHLGRIDKAKGYILATRTNLSFIQEFKKSGLHQNTKETMHAVSMLNAKANATADIISSVPNQLQEVSYSTLETRSAIEKLTGIISGEFAHIPTSVNKMLEDTLRRVIQDSFHDHVLTQTDNPGSDKVSPKYSGLDGATINQKEICSLNNSGRWILKQKQGSVAIQTWFGVVFIHSALVKAQDIVSQRGLKIRLGTSKTIRMNVEVAITPCLLRIGLFCSLIWNKISETGPRFDVKLRVYNSVDEASPIIQACQDAKLEQVQKLFAEGKASPFDRLRGKKSLLDIIFAEMFTIPIRQDPEFAIKKLEKLHLLFKMIMSYGLDPGQLWSHQDNNVYATPFPFLALICFYTPPKFITLILNTARTIIEHSVQDPFSDFTEMLRFVQSATTHTPSPVAQLIMHQEHWQPEWEIKENLRPFCHGQKPEKLGLWDARGFRTWLGLGVDHREALIAVREAFYNLTNEVCYCGLADEIADQLRYQHLVVFLEFGIDIQDERDGPSVLSLFREFGKLYSVRAALWHLKWDDDKINEFFEVDLLRSLVFQLVHLERRDFERRKLPAELQFKSVLASDWNRYIETWGTAGLNRKTSGSTTEVHPGQLRLAAMSDVTHSGAYIERQLACTRRGIFKALNTFLFVLIATVILALTFLLRM